MSYTKVTIGIHFLKQRLTIPQECDKSNQNVLHNISRIMMKVMEISQVSDMANFLRVLSFLVPIEDPNYGHLLMTIFYIQKINILLKGSVRERLCSGVVRWDEHWDRPYA